MNSKLLLTIFFIFGICHLNGQKGIDCSVGMTFSNNFEKDSKLEYFPSCPVNENQQTQAEHCCHSVHFIAFFNEPSMKISSRSFLKSSSQNRVIFYLNQVPAVPTGPPKIFS